MQFSLENDKIAAALFKVQQAIPAVYKSALNPHFKSKYAPLDTVMEAAKEGCKDNELTILQSVSDSDASGFTMDTMLLHVSGQWVSGGIRIGVGKADPQGWMSAVTYARRGSLATLLGIVADDDTDGNISGARSKAEKKQIDKINIDATAVMPFGQTKGTLLSKMADDALESAYHYAVEKKVQPDFQRQAKLILQHRMILAPDTD